MLEHQGPPAHEQPAVNKKIVCGSCAAHCTPTATVVVKTQERQRYGNLAVSPIAFDVELAMQHSNNANVKLQACNS